MERTLDLLVENATSGIDSRRGRELDELLESHSEAGGEPALDRESFELAAAAIELAYTEPEPMPPALQQRLARQAADIFEPSDRVAQDQGSAAIVPFPSSQEARSTVARSPWLGWMAAAAALVLAILGWVPEMGRQSVEPRTVAQARDELVAQSGDVLQIEWAATEDPAAANASGDVVWSDSRQEGYMRFRGLPVNDPGASQYQLWIFDREQDERYPIDGGVFNIHSEEEAIVPIDAKLAVANATLFAVTIEKPGGVVVSSRERLPLLATVG